MANQFGILASVDLTAERSVSATFYYIGRAKIEETSRRDTSSSARQSQESLSLALVQLTLRQSRYSRCTLTGAVEAPGHLTSIYCEESARREEYGV